MLPGPAWNVFTEHPDRFQFNARPGQVFQFTAQDLVRHGIGSEAMQLYPDLFHVLRSYKTVASLKIAFACHLSNLTCWEAERKGSIGYWVHPDTAENLGTKCANCTRLRKACWLDVRPFDKDYPEYISLINEKSANWLINAQPIKIDQQRKVSSYRDFFAWLWQEPYRHYANHPDLNVRTRWAKDALTAGGYVCEVNDIDRKEYYTARLRKEYSPYIFNLADEFPITKQKQSHKRFQFPKVHDEDTDNDIDDESNVDKEMEDDEDVDEDTVDEEAKEEDQYEPETVVVSGKKRKTIAVAIDRGNPGRPSLTTLTPAWITQMDQAVRNNKDLTDAQKDGVLGDLYSAWMTFSRAN
ncbi:hypothetical protein HD553DRAFT_323762 [Filobasidium floriforme]|uniref:uncharacterized protein n=1 Tax=Filobasidium floriforme TaxID=5210 RepID=UPI001E8E6D40|nr:uncharacterized protein HD553DRAFT_323762 [Filobasidium floriforme]KAH8085183.1 hypothetical protein HD553DRAFT_323762 [Filobasidium floriforme]